MPLTTLQWSSKEIENVFERECYWNVSSEMATFISIIISRKAAISISFLYHIR